MNKKSDIKKQLMLTWSFCPILTWCNRTELSRLARLLPQADSGELLAAALSALTTNHSQSAKAKQLHNIMSVAASWYNSNMK